MFQNFTTIRNFQPAKIENLIGLKWFRRLKNKAKNTRNTKTSGIWIVKIVSAEIEVQSKNFKNISNTNTVFPIDIFGSLIHYVGGI